MAGTLHRVIHEMPTRKSLDHEPGPLPEIRSDGNDMTFFLEIPCSQNGVRLTIRCDAVGNVWASILRPSDHQAS
jgi:hypothetical protein